jgi:NitT/TauT family transport system ATP-binding protein
MEDRSLTDSFIAIQHVDKVFQTKRQEIVALRDICMTFEKGEFVSIVGPSGCGKSTIIRMIDDIIKPSAGAITVDGCTYDNESPIGKDLIRRMGFIFQTPNLYPWLTVRENVMLPLKILGLSGRAYEDAADSLLNSVHMLPHADARPAEISGGMAQRIGVIRGMIHGPEILMMDEPYGALDEDTRETLNLELLKLWADSGMTIIFITHNVEEAVLLSQRVYVMSALPGTVRAELRIQFDAPRDLELLVNDKFVEYCAQIEDLIGKVDLNRIK